MMRVVDGLLALPRLLIAIVILVALSLNAATVPGIVFALSVAGWMLTARLVLGLGPTAPTASWGNIAYDGWTSSRVWDMLVATLAISVFAVSANVLADGLGDVLDPRRRGGRA